MYVHGTCALTHTVVLVRDCGEGVQLLGSVWVSYEVVWPAQAHLLLRQLAIFNFDVFSMGTCGMRATHAVGGGGGGSAGGGGAGTQSHGGNEAPAR